MIRITPCGGSIVWSAKRGSSALVGGGPRRRIAGEPQSPMVPSASDSSASSSVASRPPQPRDPRRPAARRSASVTVRSSSRMVSPPLSRLTRKVTGCPAMVPSARSSQPSAGSASRVEADLLRRARHQGLAVDLAEALPAHARLDRGQVLAAKHEAHRLDREVGAGGVGRDERRRDGSPSPRPKFGLVMV